MDKKDPDPTPISAEQIEAAEKLAAVEYTSREREQVREGIGELIDGYRALRAVPLPNELPPAVHFRPMSGQSAAPASAQGEEPSREPEALPLHDLPFPERDEDIAFAPVANLAEWIRSGRLTSERLTGIYLERLERLGPSLNCTVTLTRERAMSAARRADRELAEGRYRGPLHGIPWGAKDLFDTAGIPTCWGAEPFQGRVPDRDAAVVSALDEAGAVLIAKLSLGALAYGDIWYGGQTRSPWDLEEGSSGSSAGSAAATAAGLVGFSLGTETMGSIISPSLRCGTTGLRPSFGRVPRTGAMALCWTFDKIGPICRTVGDCWIVLSAIAGQDPGDLDSIDLPLRLEPAKKPQELRIGYRRDWFESEETSESERKAVQMLEAEGMRLVEIDLPDLPYEQIMLLVYTEAAAAFEELTLSDTDDTLTWQDAEAWPNTFRMSRFIPAIEYVQAQRFRRKVMQVMDDLFSDIDAILCPAHVESLVYITNGTGHPSLTVRTGFSEKGKPIGINLFGRLYEEGDLSLIGSALERRMGVWDRRPPLGMV